jgi:enolase
MMNIINRQEHAGNDLSLQEIHGDSNGLKTFRDTLRCGAEIYHALGARLEAKVSAAEGQRVIPAWSKCRTCD